MKTKRVFWIVLDSFGIGELPDAADFGDEGSNTLAACAATGKLNIPNMISLGLGNIEGVSCIEKAKEPKGAFGRNIEVSLGKDTTTGHWELAGLISERPFPTYPDGFPREVVDKFKETTGLDLLCNKPYSGTQLLLDFGREHVETGKPIVYTSADSVFQIAAHEDVIPVEKLYDICEKSRAFLQGEHGVGRVIARPFKGEYPDYYRTSNRHDFSLVPSKDTALDVLMQNGFDTIGVGKIYDIFAGKGVSETYRTGPNNIGMEKSAELQKKDFTGLCFINLVDFDMVYGHRNDADGYATALSEFDTWLGTFMENMNDDDVVMITADHGCDPATPSTDHSREYIPFLAYGKNIKAGVDLGTRKSYADQSKTILEIFGITESETAGESFWKEIEM
ncbi:MAG: phosphopentomutase [Oscillospiraceae bacterium]|nr:phosphopentomutase [Oscillospiraceae bacterium]